MKLERQIILNIPYLWGYKPNNIRVISERKVVSTKKHPYDVLM